MATDKSFVPGKTGRTHQLKHILEPETWTRKRNLDSHRAALYSLRKQIKGTKLEHADPEQTVFYGLDEDGSVHLIGDTPVTLQEVKDSKTGVRCYIEDGSLYAVKGDVKISASFESWRSYRGPRSPKSEAPEPKPAKPAATHAEPAKQPVKMAAKDEKHGKADPKSAKHVKKHV